MLHCWVVPPYFETVLVFFLLPLDCRGLLLQENNRFSEALHYYKLAIGSRPTLACKYSSSFYEQFQAFSVFTVSRQLQIKVCVCVCVTVRVCACLNSCSVSTLVKEWQTFDLISTGKKRPQILSYYLANIDAFACPVSRWNACAIFVYFKVSHIISHVVFSVMGGNYCCSA